MAYTKNAQEKVTEHDAGRHMDREYFKLISGLLFESSYYFTNNEAEKMHNVLLNMLGLIPRQLHPTRTHNNQTINILQHNLGTAKQLIHSNLLTNKTKASNMLWDVRLDIMSILHGASILFNKWERKDKQDFETPEESWD